MDPLKHHLFFERFLNPGRRDPPDIDIDFPWDERDHILDGIFDRYGAQRAAMVANQNSLGFRAAVREVAKVYGIAPAEIAQVAPRIMRQMDVLELAESHAARAWAESLCKEMSLKAPWPEILDLAVRAQGHFRHLSLHSGGVVIVPDEIRRYVPVEVSAKGLPVIQWEKDQTEDAGLVKIDILGNRSLAVIRDALAAIARNTGRQIDYRTWDPIPDASDSRADPSRRYHGMLLYRIAGNAFVAEKTLDRHATGTPGLCRRVRVFGHCVVPGQTRGDLICA